MIDLILYPIIAFFAAPCCYLFFIRGFLLYQLSSYRLSEWRAALKRQKKRSFFLPLFALLFVTAAILLCALLIDAHLNMIGVLALPFGSAALYLRYHKTRKLPLRYTTRLRWFTALYCLCAMLFFGGLAAAMLCFSLSPAWFALLLPFGLLAVFPVHAATNAYYTRHNGRFIERARLTLLGRKSLLKIGLTGSAGKTTAKTILAAFLCETADVLTTEGNYNTPMGIALTVEKRLSFAHEMFIAEMGARYPGDIAELCRIVRPAFGLYTNVGSQHAETFGGVSGVLNGKYELAQFLEPDGVAVFNGDDPGCRELIGRYKGQKLIYGSDRSFDAFYENHVCNECGSAFDLTVLSETVSVRTPLIGAYIPSVICGCALLAVSLGVPLSVIAAACGTLKPVAHRLQLMYNGQDVIIDDAYNANEQGAAAALEVLAAYRGRIKVVVTPGLVELGSAQAAANRRLGEKAALAADYLVVLGANAPDLKAGAKGAGMTESRIYTIRSLDELGGVLIGIPSPRAILFENDLPDQY